MIEAYYLQHSSAKFPQYNKDFDIKLRHYVFTKYWEESCKFMKHLFQVKSIHNLHCEINFYKIRERYRILKPY